MPISESTQNTCKGFRAFKTVSQFGSLSYTIIGKTADCTRLSRNVGALHASFCWPAFWRCWFHFPAGFGTCPHCQKHQKLVKWPWCWCAWFDWPANSPDLNPIENLWVLSRGKWERKRPKNADELKATVKETWASIAPQQCHKLITSMTSRIEAVIKAKGAPKYWVHIQ